MKSSSPAFQFYAADYLADADVQMMTLEEEGAYIRLLAYCWREGSIPADENLLSRLVKGGSTTLVAVVKQRFAPDPNDSTRLIHGRLEKERTKQREWSEKSSAGGKKSAKVRANKRNCEEIKGSRVVEEWLPNGTNQKSTLQSSSSSSSSKEEQPPIVPLTGDECAKPKSRIEQEFEEDWPRFWLRVGKGSALKAYIKARKKVSREEFMAAVISQGPQILARANVQGITPVHPATWMNAERWTDEPQQQLAIVQSRGRQPTKQEQATALFEARLMREWQEANEARG